jgi:myo-inositol-1(or 4)-monophosphatase
VQRSYGEEVTHVPAGAPVDGIPPDLDLAGLADLAERAARQTAELLLEGLRRPRVVVATKSSATDLVTEIDREAEALLAEILLGARPDDGLLGEEGHDREGTSGLRWIVDPIDGTTNYLYGHPGFGVSVAASFNGVPVLGVVADPMHGDLHRATLGGGATRNGEPTPSRPVPPFGEMLVATGFSYDPGRRRHQAEVLTQVLPRVRDIRRTGAAAVDLCAAAAGRVDAFYEHGLAPWDHAAGALIAREAGLRVGDLHGGDALSDFTVAAPQERFDELVALLVEAGAGTT